MAKDRTSLLMIHQAPQAKARERCNGSTMLKKQIICPQGVVIVMSDIAILASSVKAALLEIARQANALGVGLQNASPGEKGSVPNYSIQYLLDVSAYLLKKAEALDSMKENGDHSSS